MGFPRSSARYLEFRSPVPPILDQLQEMKKVDVVIVTTKLGNTIVLDRETGKPIFNFN